MGSAQPTELAGRCGSRPSNEGVVSRFIFGVGKSRFVTVIWEAVLYSPAPATSADASHTGLQCSSEEYKRERMISRGREHNK